MKGRLIVLEPMSIARYMAASEAVQHYVSQKAPPTAFVLPGWTHKGVSIGQEQPIAVIDLEACRKDGLTAARRSTEGYAIIHRTDDVAYGIVVTREYAKSKRDLDDRILRVLVRSLERINVPGCHDPFPARYGNAFIGRRKIAGSAQNTDSRNSWLQHGLIAERCHQTEDYLSYINGEKNPDVIRRRITSVEEEGGVTDPYILAAMIAEEFRLQFLENGIEFHDSALMQEEDDYIDDLMKTKHEKDDWLVYGTGRYDKSLRSSCFVEFQDVSDEQLACAVATPDKRA